MKLAINVAAILSLTETVRSSDVSSARENVISNAMNNLITFEKDTSGRVLHPHPEHPHTSPGPAPKGPKGGKKNPNNGNNGYYSTKEPKAGKKNPNAPAPTPSYNGGVYDDDDFRFPLLYDGAMKSCDWITENMYAVDYRRDTYCCDENIAGSCPISCGFNRFDDPDFTFPLIGNGNLVPCSWIAANDDAVHYRRNTYCGTVGTFCPVSCGYHPFTHFPSPSPPDNTNPKAPKGGKKGDPNSTKEPKGGNGGNGGNGTKMPKNPKNPKDGGDNYYSTKEPKAKNPKDPKDGGDNYYSTKEPKGGKKNPNPNPNPSPVAPPGYNGEVYDDTSYRFPLLFDGSMKPCSWITVNPQSVGYRREMYCSDENIAGSCPISCGFNRFDDPNFEFPLMSNGSMQPCSWIEQNGDSIGYRRDIYCGSFGTFCPVSCGYHPYNTFPSPRPPTPPGNTPPKGGKKSNKSPGGGKGKGYAYPSPSPPSVPSTPSTPSSPTYNGDEDDPDFTFPLYWNGVEQPCSWLTLNPESIEYRRDTYCTDTEIAVHCPVSCGTNAPPPSPPSATPVSDDPEYRFPLFHDGTMQPCLWISQLSSAVEYRRATYCTDMNIAGSCPISCGFDEYDDPDFYFLVEVNQKMQPCHWIAGEYRRNLYCGDAEVSEHCPQTCLFYPFNTYPSPAPPTTSPPAGPPANNPSNPAPTKSPKASKKGSAKSSPSPAPVPNIPRSTTSGSTDVAKNPIVVALTTLLASLFFV